MSSIVADLPDIFGIPKHVYFQTQFGDEPYYPYSTGILAYPLYINNTGNYNILKIDNIETFVNIPITTNGKKGSLIKLSGRWSYHTELKEGELYNTSDLDFDQEDPPKKAAKHETEKIIEDFYINEVVNVTLSPGPNNKIIKSIITTTGIVKGFLKPTKFDVNGSVIIELTTDLNLEKSEQFFISISSLCYATNIIQDTNYCCVQSYNSSGFGGAIYVGYGIDYFDEIKNPYVISNSKEVTIYEYKSKLFGYAKVTNDEKTINKPYKDIKVGLNLAIKYTKNTEYQEYTVITTDPADDGTYTSYLKVIKHGYLKDISYEPFSWSHTFSDNDIQPTGDAWDNMSDNDKKRNWSNGKRIYELGTKVSSRNTITNQQFMLPYRRKISGPGEVPARYESGSNKVYAGDFITRTWEYYEISLPEDQDYMPGGNPIFIADYNQNTKIKFFPS